MAYTYTNSPVLSKIKIGDNYYYLKDADVRAILDTFNNAIVTGTIAPNAASGNTSDLVTLGTVKDYVNAQVGAINKFDVQVTTASKVESLPTADDMYILYLVPDPDAIAGGYIEYIALRSGTEGSYTYSWEQIGSTTIDLTGYLTDNATVAGVGFTNGDVPVEDLKTALNLGKLAHADQVTGSVTVPSTIDQHTYTPAGSVTVTPKYTATAATFTGSYTPAGGVTGTVTPNGGVSATRNNTNGAFQVSGTISSPTVSVSLSSDSFLRNVKTEGVTPTYTEGEFTPATITYASKNFATNGIVASIGQNGTADEETLIFGDATLASASNITAFNGGSKEADTFNAGSMPEFNTGSAAIGVESATASAPSFTGDKFDLTFSGSASTINATFAGTAATLSVSGNYDKTGIESASFTGTTATLTHTVNTKTVTVTSKPATGSNN